MTPGAVVATGLGCELSSACDGGPYLHNRKMRKFMGLQDALAVAAAGRALEQAGLLRGLPPERTGLYLAVGYLPFEREDIERLLQGSLDPAGAVTMERFSTAGYGAVNPLLTFRCLSNMPAFHVSLNFDVQGPYLVTYPGPGQLYQALETACAALEAGAVDVALWGGVAHQRNFLVEHHFARLDPPVPAARLRDGAACLVLERAESARARGAGARARLLERALSYEPRHPFEEERPAEERFSGAPAPEGELGPASLPVALAAATPGLVTHTVRARDGLAGTSRWELLA